MEKSKKNVGPIMASLVVIILLAAIGLYIFVSHINHQTNTGLNIASSTASIQSNNADDLQTLKKDLNNAIK
jgi:Tfp pilus assembly protein PilN